MQKRAILASQKPYSLITEVYLLWKPLARLGDLSQFGPAGHWRLASQSVKRILFTQILLGLLGLHKGGGIHRNLKPANLGIVKLREAPMAVIIDEGQACRQIPVGCKTRIGTCGTVGYLAPELENSAIAQFYGTKVDIWSLGAVAYFLFNGGRITWSLEYNIFVPARNSQDPTLHLFREARASLLLQSMDTIQNLFGIMLEENPYRRPMFNRFLRTQHYKICAQQ
jgi:serine/threonine protein kinase